MNYMCKDFFTRRHRRGPPGAHHHDDHGHLIRPKGMEFTPDVVTRGRTDGRWGRGDGEHLQALG